MADLSIGSGSGAAQSTTQSPQSLVGSGTSTAPGSNVQPGTSTSLLNNSSGISLGNSNLSTIDLNSTSTTAGSTSVAKAAPQAAPATHHINTSLLGVCLGLLVVAVASFFYMNQAEKNTTNYK
jgi:hypothetical protein